MTSYHQSAIEKIFCDCDASGLALEGNTGHTASCNRKQRKTAANIKKQTEKKATHKAVNKISDKMAKQLSIYEKKRKQHLNHHPDCQIKLVGCTNKNNSVHHSARRGKNINNEKTFLTACDFCHHQIEFVLSAKENREKGFLVTV